MDFFSTFIMKILQRNEAAFEVYTRNNRVMIDFLYARNMTLTSIANRANVHTLSKYYSFSMESIVV